MFGLGPDTLTEGQQIILALFVMALALRAPIINGLRPRGIEDDDDESPEPDQARKGTPASAEGGEDSTAQGGLLRSGSGPLGEDTGRGNQEVESGREESASPDPCEGGVSAMSASYCLRRARLFRLMYWVSLVCLVLELGMERIIGVVLFAVLAFTNRYLWRAYEREHEREVHNGR